MKQATKERRRRALDKHRKGNVTVAIPFPVGEPMFVKACRVCGKACPYTIPSYKFACSECYLLFD